MTDTLHSAPPPDPARVDHCVLFRDVPMAQYEALLAARGDERSPSMIYLRGNLWIMSPSPEHESISRMVHTLLMTYAEERSIDLRAFGAWTVRGVDRGAEADESYVLGERSRDAPDLAIEIVWTSEIGAKLEVWRGLGVPEVWIWKQGHLAVHLLRDDRYELQDQSALFPDLDLALIARLATRRDQIAAMRELRAAVRHRDA